MIPVYFCFDFRKVKQNLKAKHCVKYCNFTPFFGVEILWKDRFLKGKLPETMRKLPFHKISSPGNKVKLRYFSQ